MNFEKSQKPQKNGKFKARLQYYWHRVKKALRSQLKSIPYIDTVGTKFWRGLKVFYRNLIFYQLKLKELFIYRGASLAKDEINAIIHVSPKDIVFESCGKFSDMVGRGIVIGGDWDKLEKRFDDLAIYKAFREVIKEKKKWQETTDYLRALSKMEGGEICWGCSTKDELDKRFEMQYELIDSIRKNGYKSQKELGSERINDEVILNIGRDGDLIFSNGNHRLSIAKILEIEKIPVNISVRHSDWVRFRKQFEKMAVLRGGKTYQPTLHPDLQFIPSHHGCIDRLEIIQRNLSAKEGKLLDLGANLGYFCSRFEEEGFACVAVENDPELSYCLKKLKRATNKHFEIIEESILDSKAILKDSYDVVLALNIFHHFLKTEERYTKFLYFLENLRCKEFYFEPHQYSEPQMKNAYQNFQPEEFAELVRQKTRLTTSELIGKTKDGRQIFKIT